MKTVTYSQIEALANDLAGGIRDKLPTSEATMLRAFFAEELADLWTRDGGTTVYGAVLWRAV